MKKRLLILSFFLTASLTSVNSLAGGANFNLLFQNSEKNINHSISLSGDYRAWNEVEYAPQYNCEELEPNAAKIGGPVRFSADSIYAATIQYAFGPPCKAGGKPVDSYVNILLVNVGTSTKRCYRGDWGYGHLLPGAGVNACLYWIEPTVKKGGDSLKYSLGIYVDSPLTEGELAAYRLTLINNE